MEQFPVARPQANPDARLLLDARSGEPALISGYLGEADTFDQAIASFAVTYADQVERDYERFTKAVSEGKIESRMDEGG